MSQAYRRLLMMEACMKGINAEVMRITDRIQPQDLIAPPGG